MGAGTRGDITRKHFMTRDEHGGGRDVTVVADMMRAMLQLRILVTSHETDVQYYWWIVAAEVEDDHPGAYR